MNADEIRELAIERMGAAIAEHDKVLQYGTDFDSCQCGWAGDEDDWGEHVADAAAVALGDLLPTVTETRKHRIWRQRDGEISDVYERRHLTEWSKWKTVSGNVKRFGVEVTYHDEQRLQSSLDAILEAEARASVALDRGDCGTYAVGGPVEGAYTRKPRKDDTDA